MQCDTESEAATGMLSKEHLDDLCEKLNRLYQQHGTNYVQWAVAAITALRAKNVLLCREDNEIKAARSHLQERDRLLRELQELKETCYVLRVQMQDYDALVAENAKLKAQGNVV